MLPDIRFPEAFFHWMDVLYAMYSMSSDIHLEPVPYKWVPWKTILNYYT